MADPRTEGFDNSPFIEFGPGGRDLKDAREEEGVAEGVSTSAARGVSFDSDDFVSKNE